MTIPPKKSSSPEVSSSREDMPSHEGVSPHEPSAPREGSTSHEGASGGVFPVVRMRRLRSLAPLRAMLRHTTLEPRNFVLPLFVRHGAGVRSPIASMPGHFQLSVDQLAAEARAARSLGLGGVILFGIPASKDPTGSEAMSPRGIVPQAIRAIKDAAPELLTITDVCCCEYTDHGHCGVLKKVSGTVSEAATVDNDATLALLARQAVAHAEAGADVVAPSGMMDGMVGAIRAGLDAAGHSQTPILSYAAKYASAFYGPFREAAESAPQMGDRRGYQMDPAADPGQALREVALDLSEGADMVMVKPALAYLDILRAVADKFPGVPLAAYNVSGEYSMIKAAAAQGWLDERAAALESLVAMRRAGAQILITYWAKQAVEWL
jgi:porphobilinogen synthase